LTKPLDHSQRRTTVARTPLDERSARRRDFYLTTHNIKSGETSMPTAGFETTIPVRQRPQTQDVVRAATGTGNYYYLPGLYGRQSSIHMFTKARHLSLCSPAHDRGSHAFEIHFLYPLTMRNLSKLFLFYVSSYHHSPPPPLLSSSPYMSRPSFTTSFDHTHNVW